MTKYEQAIAESESLINSLREASRSSHPVRDLVRDIWNHRRNTPYITTIYEANQEMLAPLLHSEGNVVRGKWPS